MFDRVENMWMCELCYADGIEVKYFGDGLALIFNKDKYHLLAGQGHNGDELFTFDVKPIPDPYPQILDDEIWKTYVPTSEQEKAADEWRDHINSLDYPV